MILAMFGYIHDASVGATLDRGRIPSATPSDEANMNGHCF